MSTEQQMKIPTSILIDIPLYDGSIDDAVEICLQVCTDPANSRENRCISLTGAHGIVFAQKIPHFKEILQGFYMNLPDGMPGVWASRLKGANKIERCYGPDFFEAMMRASASTPIKHYLCGGKEGVADKLKKVCKSQFGNDNIVGTFSPPFRPVEQFDYRTIAEDINRSGADLVWIGLSTPKQEQFATRLSKYTDVHILATVGAAFDFHIGNVRQAPKIVQQTGFEWLFRMLTEPGRLFRRYLEIVPKFLFYSVREIIRYKWKKS